MDDETYERFVRRLQAQGRGTMPAAYPADRAEVIQSLKDASRKGNLVLVLGAGVSIPSGLPSWDEVTSKLIAAVLPDRKSRDLAIRLKHIDLPAYRRTRIVESLSAAFRLTVRDTLYGQRLRPNMTLKAITAFAQRTRRSRKSLRIVTYNFDDLLERSFDQTSLRGNYLVVDSKASYEQFKASNPRIAIFHPHGFVPLDGNLERLLGAMLVFSERQYHRSYFDPLHWTSVIQKECFSSAACLFIGCSFNDQDQRRLLDQVNTKTSPCLAAIMRKSTKFKKQRNNELTDYILQHDLALLNVKALWVKNWSGIPTILNRFLN